MTSPSTTVILPPDESHDSPQKKPPRHSPMEWFMHRDRLWLVLIIVMVAALFLGGCQARGGDCHAHASSCGSSGGEAFLAVFYVVYIIGWAIACGAGG